MQLSKYILPFYLGLLSACATPNVKTPPDSTVVKVPEPKAAIVVESSPAPEKKLSVSEKLRQDATEAMDNGDLAKASRILDRALGIDARDPATYYMFAQVHSKDDKHDKALQFIEKGLSLGPSEALKRKLLTLKKSVNKQKQATQT